MIDLPEFQVISYNKENVIHARVDAAMKPGIAVNLKAGEEDPFVFELATAVHGYFLVNEVIANDDAGYKTQLENDIFMTSSNFRSPLLVGSVVSAFRANIVVVEGSNYLDVSVDDETAVDTPLTFKSGKFATIASTEEVVGYLRLQLTPKTSGNARVRIEMVK